jgi:hypothetical protein
MPLDFRLLHSCMRFNRMSSLKAMEHFQYADNQLDLELSF